MITIVSGYTMARRSLMENPDLSEWVPTSLCDNPRRSYPEKSVPEHINLIVI